LANIRFNPKALLKNIRKYISSIIEQFLLSYNLIFSIHNLKTFLTNPISSFTFNLFYIVQIYLIKKQLIE